jgi:para-nitrobenzyl esterase
LGALGFLYLDDASAPVNVGLRDANAALKWIRRNIGGFGGDADRLTLAGSGAAAAVARALVAEEGVVGLVQHGEPSANYLDLTEAFKRFVSYATFMLYVPIR